MDTRALVKIALFIAIGFSMTAASLAYSPPNSADETTYVGPANLSVGVDFIKAGGGPGSFSMVRAWNNMIGPSALEAVLSGLASSHGEAAADQFVHIFNFAIDDAWRRAGMDDVSMPEPNENSGRDLALTLLQEGTAPNGQVFAGYLLGHVLSPRIYAQVAADINATYGPEAGAQFLSMSDEFLSLVAQQMGYSPLG